MNQRAAAAVLLPLALASFTGSAAADDASDYRELLERVSPSIVGLKVVIKTEFDFGGSLQDQESTLDARGAVVDASGLILVWNSQISASRLIEAAQQMGGGEGLQLKITPTDFRVAVEGHEKEYRAFLVGQDSDLDIAFLQIEEPLARPLAAIEFEGAGRARVGETVVGVARLSPSFDGAAYFETGRIAGEVRKPRRAWVLDASPALLGLPVFNLKGEPVGVVATILSRVAESGPSGADMMGFFSLGRGGVESGPLGLFLLPADRVRGVVREAKKRAATLLAERQAEKKAG